MNTKKADWINQPFIEKKTLHSLTIKADGNHTLLFVAGENEEITLSIKTDIPYGFLLLHTPEEYVLIKKDRAETLFNNTKTIIPISEQLNKIIFRKNGKKITLLNESNLILSIEKDAFLSSSAFGITIEGQGEAYIEVF